MAGSAGLRLFVVLEAFVAVAAVAALGVFRAFGALDAVLRLGDFFAGCSDCLGKGSSGSACGLIGWAEEVKGEGGEKGWRIWRRREGFPYALKADWLVGRAASSCGG